MVRPSSRPGTSNRQFIRRIPKDVARVLDSLPPSYRPKGWGKEFITISTGAADKRQADMVFARIAADVEARFAALRAGARTLSQKESVAIAGTIYEAFAKDFEENPGKPETWESVLQANRDAQGGKFGRAVLMIGDDAELRAASMEERFGPLVDAALGHECLIIDAGNRKRLLEHVAAALDDAGRKLKKNADGDFSPDPVAARFPPRTKQSPKTGAKLTLPALFEKWAKHPEQQTQAGRTVSRYQGVFNALDVFLKRPDAREVTTADIRRYTDALMTEEKLRPRTVRDVHRAAISSVFNWAIGKGIVQNNPATGVQIKVGKAKSLRSKDLTDAEARALMTVCLALPPGAPHRTQEAAQRWCPLICLYSGCRIGEAVQLRKEDFRVDGPTHVMRITPEAGTVKTGEFRDVPVHTRLIELGLLTFIEGGPQGSLFFDPATPCKVANPKTPLSELVARKVTDWARATCLPDPLLEKPLHGPQHRFMTVARRAGIDEQYVKAITGHTQDGQSQQYGQYEISSLARELEKLTPERVEGTQ